MVNHHTCPDCRSTHWNCLEVLIEFGGCTIQEAAGRVQYCPLCWWNCLGLEITPWLAYLRTIDSLNYCPPCHGRPEIGVIRPSLKELLDPAGTLLTPGSAWTPYSGVQRNFFEFSRLRGEWVMATVGRGGAERLVRETPKLAPGELRCGCNKCAQLGF